MPSFRGLGKRARSLSRSIRRTFGREVSDSDSEYDSDGQLSPYNPDDDTELQERMLLEQVTGPQARSTTRMQSEHDDQRRIFKERRRLARQQQAEAAMVRHNNQIDAIVRSISEALGTNVDAVDPRIRFVIGQIVNVHGLTLHSLRLMRRSTILLSAIGDIASRAGRGLVDAGQVVYSAGEAALAALRVAGSFASRGASLVTSRLPSWNTSFIFT